MTIKLSLEDVQAVGRLWIRPAKRSLSSSSPTQGFHLIDEPSWLLDAMLTVPPTTLRWDGMIGKERLEISARADAVLLNRNHDVEFPPASRHIGSRRRPPTQHTRRAQELLPRLQIVGPPHPKIPFRRYQVPDRGKPAIVEGDVSGSFDISCVLRQNYIYSLPRGCRGCRCGS